jgi:hypothetical protein
MTVIVNNLEIIGQSPDRQEQRNTDLANLPPTGLTPRDLYWANRKLAERQGRSQAC